jgi:hypothetical protein
VGSFGEEDAMDSTRFDTVTRDFARLRSRRHLLRAVVASAGVVLVARQTAGATPGIKPIRCDKRGDSCSTVNGDSCCKNSFCNSELVCQKIGRIKTE